MKRMMALVGAFLLMLAGCAEPQQVAMPDAASAEPLAFQFETLGTFTPSEYDSSTSLAAALGGEAVRDQTVLIRIASIEDLVAFEKKASDLLQVEYALLQNSTGRFYREMEAFFEENALLLIYQSTPTGMAVCWVERVENCEDEITILVKMGIPQPCDEDTGACLMGVELLQSSLADCKVQVEVETQLVAVC